MVAPTPPAPTNFSAPMVTAPALFAAAIAPSDTVNNPCVFRAIYVGGAGDIAIITPSSTTVVLFVGVPAGSILPVMNARVNLTNTTASLMVGLG